MPRRPPHLQVCRTPTRTPGDGRGRAFSLIELLVVISIVAVLVAILLPSLGGARKAASGVVCQSNLRQMATAALAYSLDNNERLPSARGYEDGGSQNAWFFQLAPYLTTKVAEIVVCPDDHSPYWTQPSPVTDTLRRSSYSTNFYISGRMIGYQNYDSLTLIPRPANTILAAETAETGNYATADHFHPELWLSSSDRPDRQIALERHAGASNWSYLDGHVALRKLPEVYLLNPESRIGRLVWDVNHLNPRVAK